MRSRGPGPHVGIVRRDQKTRSLSAWRGHSKRRAVCKAGRGFSPGTEPAGTFLLDFPACRTVRDSWRLSHPVHRILLQQPKQTNAAPYKSHPSDLPVVQLLLDMGPGDAGPAEEGLKAQAEGLTPSGRGCWELLWVLKSRRK